VAGLCITWAGERVCFLVNAISYIAVIAALFFVKAKQRKIDSSKNGAISRLKEGFLYTLRTTPIRNLILLLALIGLFTIPFTILMPALAKDVFHGNASTLGFLTGSSGAGSVIGALFLTSRRGTKKLGKLIIVGCALCGLALILLGSSSTLPLALMAVTGVGFGNMIAMAGSNTLIQTIVDEDKRGRVMSFMVMALLGLAPFGCMIAGGLASIIGVGRTVLVEGILTVILATAFASLIIPIHSTVPQAPDRESAEPTESEQTEPALEPEPELEMIVATT
jgi:MFS family permease